MIPEKMKAKQRINKSPLHKGKYVCCYDQGWLTTVMGCYLIMTIFSLGQGSKSVERWSGILAERTAPTPLRSA